MRRTRMRRWRPRNERGKYGRRERGYEYMGFVHRLPCMVLVIGPPVGEFESRWLVCSGPIQADHAGERIAGMGTRSRDRDCIPVCLGHHDQLTGYRGLFADRVVRTSWRSAAIAATQEFAIGSGIEVPTC